MTEKYFSEIFFEIWTTAIADRFGKQYSIIDSLTELHLKMKTNNFCKQVGSSYFAA